MREQRKSDLPQYHIRTDVPATLSRYSECPATCPVFSLSPLSPLSRLQSLRLLSRPGGTGGETVGARSSPLRFLSLLIRRTEEIILF